MVKKHLPPPLSSLNASSAESLALPRNDQNSDGSVQHGNGGSSRDNGRKVNGSPVNGNAVPAVPANAGGNGHARNGAKKHTDATDATAGNPATNGSTKRRETMVAGKGGVTPLLRNRIGELVLAEEVA